MERKPERSPAPLVRPWQLRFLVAVGLLAAALLLAVVALGTWLLGDRASWAAVVPPLLLCALPTAVVATRGGWAVGRWGLVERGAVAVLVAGVVVAALGSVVAGVDALVEREVLGASSDSIATQFTVATAMLIGATALVACIPLPLARRTAIALLAGLATAVVACGAATAAVARGPDSCEQFRFDRERWQAAVRDGGSDDGETIAGAIERCGTLTGRTAAQVRALLGPPPDGRGADVTSWLVGRRTVNGSEGDVTLDLLFAHGRVVEANVGEPYAD